MQVLGVFYAPAEILRAAVGQVNGLIGVQHFPVGPVADGVGSQLEAIGKGYLGGGRVVVQVCRRETSSREVVIRLQHPGAV